MTKKQKKNKEKHNKKRFICFYTIVYREEKIPKDPHFFAATKREAVKKIRQLKKMMTYNKELEKKDYIFRKAQFLRDIYLLDLKTLECWEWEESLDGTKYSPFQKFVNRKDWVEELKDCLKIYWREMDRDLIRRILIYIRDEAKVRQFYWLTYGLDDEFFKKANVELKERGHWLMIKDYDEQFIENAETLHNRILEEKARMAITSKMSNKKALRELLEKELYDYLDEYENFEEIINKIVKKLVNSKRRTKEKNKRG